MATDVHQENKDVYLNEEEIREYIDQDYLFAPERKIIELLEGELKKSIMLDIGVGGGRTTRHFSPLVRQYVGIDYSESMLDICKTGYSTDSGKISFHLADMRSLEIFADKTFDFILISYNAISTLSHLDRLKTFSELKRVGKPPGYLFFSAHNLQWVPTVLLNFSRQISLTHPRLTYWNLLKLINAYRYNKKYVIKHIHELPYAFINDGAHNFKLLHYYIKPWEQVKQLSNYFTNIRVFGLNGHELEKGELGTNTDGFLHYLCRFS